MISKPNSISTYIKMHPIKSVALSVFTLFAILGAGFGTLYVVAPNTAQAVITGGPGCCGGGWEPWYPSPIFEREPNFGIGGGGGSAPIPITPSCELTVTPSSITLGGNALLSWSTTNASAASIDQGIGTVSVPTGSRTVSPTTNTTYTMTVVSTTGHTAICSDAVTVVPVDTQPVCTLDITASTVTEGDSTKLSWTTSRASTVTISPAKWGVSGGNLPANGSVTITPLATTTYTLTATDGDGDSVTCTDTVNVVQIQPPVCVLSIAPDVIELGESAEIAWEVRRANDFDINRGIGDVPFFTTPVANGTIPISPDSVGTFTYTGTAKNSRGDTAVCSDTITVTKAPVDTEPVCELIAADTLIPPGSTTTISWTIKNAVTALLNGNSIAPTDGSKTVGAGTHTLVVEDNDGDSDICKVTIKEEVPDTAPVCVMTITDGLTGPNDTATISWTIDRATTATLNGSAISPTDGSKTVGAGTHTLVVKDNDNDSDTCQVIIEPFVPGLACVLTIDRDSMQTGESATMSWETQGASRFLINGTEKDLNGSETIRPTAITTHTFEGKAVDADGNIVRCSDSVTVTGGGGGGGALICDLTLGDNSIIQGQSTQLVWRSNRATAVTINQGLGDVPLNGVTDVGSNLALGSHEFVMTATRGGQEVICRDTLTVSGGGGGSVSPQITLDFLKVPGEQPLAFISLSQIPYTGIELTGIGALLYWLLLFIWSGAAAYLVLFKLLPYTTRKFVAAGQAVRSEQKQDTIEESMPEETRAMVHQEGFTPEKESSNEQLTVEDIVRGLSRKYEASAVREETPEVEVEDTDVVEEMGREPVAEESAPVATQTSSDDEALRFLNALMAGDRDATFSMLRRSVRSGGRPEELIERVLVHLDSAYRARIEGSGCAEDVRRICAQADTALLEEVIGALTSAIDTTYSQSQTGVKLALTRAHQVIARG